jgi:tetratricopeptide (TPR) repeat protein
MSDDVRRWSDELARDPASLVFLPLGETLRRRGELALAERVALRGLERHPHHADAHDLLARISVDRGDAERARDEWGMALRLAPQHAGALCGIGFLSFAEGRLEEAADYLARVAAAAPSDAGAAAALARVRDVLSAGPAAPAAVAAPDRSARVATRSLESGGPDAARTLFAEILGDGEHTALLLDADGRVLAGEYLLPDGHDIAQEVAVELNGVSDEAHRAMRHLGLGAWQAVVFETEVATVAMGAAHGGAIVLVAATLATPLGFVRRTLARALACAGEWLGRAA